MSDNDLVTPWARHRARHCTQIASLNLHHLTQYNCLHFTDEETQLRERRSPAPDHTAETWFWSICALSMPPCCPASCSDLATVGHEERERGGKLGARKYVKRDETIRIKSSRTHVIWDLYPGFNQPACTLRLGKGWGEGGAGAAAGRGGRRDREEFPQRASPSSGGPGICAVTGVLE